MEMQLLESGRYYHPAKRPATEVGANPDPVEILGHPLPVWSELLLDISLCGWGT